VISRLVELNYLDDKRFAEMYTAVRLDNDGFGKARILQDLRAKRVPGEFAEEAVSRAFEDKNEDEMVGDYIERRMPAVAAGDHKGDDRKIAAAYRKLRRAGFSTNSILTVLRKYAAHPELLDEPPPEDDLPDV
jgi:regulatory protein